MDKFQTTKLDSLKLIVKESSNNPASIALVPTFGTVVNQLDQICSEIEKRQTLQEKDLTGITADKDIALEDMADSTLEIAGAVYSWAHDRNDNTLMAKVDFKKNRIDTMTQSELGSTARIVLEEAVKIPSDELANEGISANELTAYQSSIAHFGEVKSSKNEAVIDRSGTTEKLNLLFKQANTLLKNKLDRLAVQFKRKDPDFYLKYKAARKVHYRSAPKKGTEDTTSTGA
jgi:hypothetical protein